MVSINILSWNRPILLQLTLRSLAYSLRNCSVPFEIIILDQGSKSKTLALLDQWESQVTKIIRLNQNIGIAAGWDAMYEVSRGDHILPIEDDWFCDASSSAWLITAIKVLKNDSNIAFVKLRRIVDHDNYGYGLITHAPWTVKPYPFGTYETRRIDEKNHYYCATSEYISFTFNPTLMPRSFRDYIGSYYLDDPENETPLRSGEDLPSEIWRNQSDHLGATLIDGPFRHTGFHTRLPKLTTLPKYMFKSRARQLFKL